MTAAEEPHYLLQKKEPWFKELHNFINNVYRKLQGQGIGIQTKSTEILMEEELGTFWEKGILCFLRLRNASLSKCR